MLGSESRQINVFCNSGTLVDKIILLAIVIYNLTTLQDYEDSCNVYNRSRIGSYCDSAKSSFVQCLSLWSGAMQWFISKW